MVLPWSLAITSMDTIEKGANDLRSQRLGSTRHAVPGKVHVRRPVNDTQPLTTGRHVHIRLGTRLPRGTSKFIVTSPRE